MLTRRTWLGLLLAGACAGVVVAPSGTARAAETLEVVAANNAVGAIVAAEGGDAVQVAVDRTLGPTQIRIAGAVVDVSGTILLKGRFLDDPRNATKLGASIRKALVQVRPDLKAQFEANHKAWTHPFARRVIAWNARLAKSSVRGQRVADVHGRAALLEWAGAGIDPKSSAKGPAALAKAPGGPAAPTLASYIEYIEALVVALA
jgi:hypothetical protein